MTKTPDISLCLAPMRGITTNIYRNVHDRLFPGLTRAIAPFIPTVKNKVTPKLLRDLLPENNNVSYPIIPQVIGRDPEDMLTLLTAFHDLGYPEANWNLGCPWPQVAKKKRGSGLLNHPELIQDALDHVCGSMPGKLSVKVRLGTDNKEDLFKLFPLFDQYPLTEIIIHPRTAKQMYEGTADIDSFEKCIGATRHRLCYNGDIDSPEFFIQLQARFPMINRWMIGRGLLENPFLASRINHRIPSLTPSQKLKMIQDFHDQLYSIYSGTLYGPASILGKMKEFWSYLSNSFEHPQKLFKRIKKVQKLQQYEDIVKDIFENSTWFDTPRTIGRNH